jgi:HAD superfamily hydrolase (TIGR01450 family)
LTAALAGCTAAPAATYDVALLDLDGVVYIGSHAVPHAVDALAEASRTGMRTAFVTNNASRTPQQVADRLAELGVPATADDVVTSAQAAATLLAGRLDPGDAVLVTGAGALREAVSAVGLRPVDSAADSPRAVVMGYDPTLDYARLAEATVAIRGGALFVASNLDATLPSPRGPLPGMGSLAALVITATGQQPIVAGKPERPLMDESVIRTAARNPLVVGDRLDTDIEGAHRSGLPSLLVMTGVTDLLAVATAPRELRPSLIAADLRGLNRPHPPAESGRCGDAVAEYDATKRQVVVRSAGDNAQDETLLAVVSAAWDAADAGNLVDAVDAI